MTAQTRATLKTYFQTGDKPTSSNFGDQIDSFLSLLDTPAQNIVSSLGVAGSIIVSGNANVSTGFVVGAPTGGNKGPGTINAGGIYINGTLITTTSAGGSGTVNVGVANQLAFYSTSTNSVSGTNAIPNGTTATAQTAGDTSSKIVPYSALAQGANGATSVLLQTQTASNVASLNFINIPTGYDQYEFRLTNLIPVTNAAGLWARVSENNGSSYIATSSYYGSQILTNINSTQNGTGQNLSAELAISVLTISNNPTQGGISGKIVFYSLGSTALVKQQTFHIVGADSTISGTPSSSYGGGAYYGDDAAVNAIQFLMSSGNISSGTISLYGIRNA